MSRPLRILMVNRQDAGRVPGGDTIQLQKTCEALQQLSIAVDARLADDLEGPWDYDLVHIFNIQSAEDSWYTCEVAKSKGLPVVLSPIYWEPLPMWYWANPNLNAIWRAARGTLGKWGYGPFAAWQRLRYPASETWQLQRRLLTTADLLLPNSQAEAQQIIHDFRLGEAQRPYVIVPNAIERQLFDPAPKASDHNGLLPGIKTFVLEVGRVSPEKNSLGLIEALWDIDIPLVFVGKASPYAPGYFEECRRLGHKRGNVHFVDWLPHEQLPSIYARATVHCLPSWRETPGLVSLEAAAAGCRVVSTSLGSAYEYLGDEAWYCHPWDKESIRHAVVCALQAPSPERLRQRILENYTWEKAAQATLAAYYQVLGKRRFQIGSST